MVKVDVVSSKLIRLIITGLLHFSGKVCPVFIYALISELKLDKRTEEIVILRYINNEKFEAIPDLLKSRCELRQVFKLHQQFINNLYHLVITYKIKS